MMVDILISFQEEILNLLSEGALRIAFCKEGLYFVLGRRKRNQLMTLMHVWEPLNAHFQMITRMSSFHCSDNVSIE